MNHLDLCDPHTLALTTELDTFNKLCDIAQVHTARPAHEGHVIMYMPWTLDTATAMASLGLPSPSPMMRDYKYPPLHGRFAPFPHQRDIAEFLSVNKRAYCFGGMGVGKTAATIWAAEYLISVGAVKRVLIVGTKSTMSPVWSDTLFSLAMGRTVTILRGSQAIRRRRAQDEAQYHIINHDGLGVCMQQLLHNAYDLIIVDESTAFKNARSQRWEYINKLAKQASRVWALTGSPTPRSPEDAYGQIKLVRPDVAPKYMTSWRNLTMEQISMYKWRPKTTARDTVFSYMQPAIHIRKEDVLKDQPETMIVEREIELTPQQNKLLKQLKNNEVLTTASGTTITPVHAAAALTKYMQIMLGAVYDDEGEVAVIDNAPRIQVVIELIEAGRESGVGTWDKPLGKAIVAVPYKHVLTLYEEQLREAGYKVGVIYGGVASKARDDVVHKFQNTDEIEVLLVIPDAIAHGLTLTAANTFIWCSPLVRPEVFQQANERMDRPGQVQTMTQARLYGSSVERHYYKSKDDSQDWQNELLRMYTDMINSI